jgi:ABC-type multidrug transport system fused ATPase/permease subunit
MNTERTMRRASATHALSPRMTDSPRRRALLGALVLNGALRAGGAILVALVVQRAVDGALSRLLLAAASLVAAVAFVALRARERSDAARLGDDFAFDLGPTIDASRIGPTRRWIAGLAQLAAAGATIVGALGALAVLDVSFALAAGAVLVAGALGVAIAGARPAPMAARARGIGVVSEVCAVLVPAAVLVAGAGRASAGTVAAGLVVAALLAVALRQAGQVPQAWAAAAVDKVRAALAEPTATPEWPLARPLPDGPGWIAFSGATVEGVLEDVDVSAEPGSVIAVLGLGGSGKTTLAALAARALDPDAGSVTLDGHDLRRVETESLRRAIGLAGPGLPLLHGDVEANLRYRWRDAPAAELDRVRELTGLADVLDGLPQEWLSDAQRLRLGLARALVGDPRLLIVDEVDELLETGAAGVIDRILAERRGRATTILVTEWPELAQSADVVWRLSEGRLIAAGPPQRVLT